MDRGFAARFRSAAGPRAVHLPVTDRNWNRLAAACSSASETLISLFHRKRAHGWLKPHEIRDNSCNSSLEQTHEIVDSTKGVATQARQRRTMVAISIPPVIPARLASGIRCVKLEPGLAPRLPQ